MDIIGLGLYYGVLTSDFAELCTEYMAANCGVSLFELFLHENNSK